MAAGWNAGREAATRRELSSGIPGSCAMASLRNEDRSGKEFFAASVELPEYQLHQAWDAINGSNPLLLNKLLQPYFLFLIPLA